MYWIGWSLFFGGIVLFPPLAVLGLVIVLIAWGISRSAKQNAKALADELEKRNVPHET